MNPVEGGKVEEVVIEKVEEKPEVEKEEKPKPKFKKKSPIKDSDDGKDDQMSLF